MESELSIASGRKVYRAKQMKELLGIGKTMYYEICKLGLLQYSRLKPGGPRVHTQQQLEDYLAYLNRNPVAVAQKFPRRVRTFR